MFVNLPSNDGGFLTTFLLPPQSPTCIAGWQLATSHSAYFPIGGNTLPATQAPHHRIASSAREVQRLNGRRPRDLPIKRKTAESLNRSQNLRGGNLTQSKPFQSFSALTTANNRPTPFRQLANCVHLHISLAAKRQRQ
jgi:hypothetical protein